MDIAAASLLALGLGLLGFVEPCSVGGHLLFIKYLERRSPRQRIVQTLAFTLTRATLMAGLGMIAALIGTAFTGLQQGLWAILGGLYVLVGLIYLGGGAPQVIAAVNRLLPRLSAASGSVGLGALFGLNVPACAAPLLAVLLGDAAARAATGAPLAYGALTLLIFGLALSSPLLLAVFTRRGRRLRDAITGLAGRLPRWTGVLLVALGVWSILLALS